MKDLRELTMAELNAEIERTEQLLWDMRERRMELAVALIQERNRNEDVQQLPTAVQA